MNTRSALIRDQPLPLRQDELRIHGHAIGINGIDGNGGPDSGAVYVFVRSGDTWSEQAYVKASNAEQSDGFGFAVALSSDGSTLVATALV